MKTTHTILGLFFLFVVQFVFAQTGNIQNISDSLNTSLLADFSKKASAIEHQRITDSTQKAYLEAQVISLKKNENGKKEELQKQLEELSVKESKRIAEKIARIDYLRFSAKSFPVNGFFDDTLFLIYSKLGSFSAQERAEAITKRIKKMVHKFDFDTNSIEIIEAETILDLAFGETIIMSISENDALWNNTTKWELANQYKTIIENAVFKCKAETSVSTLVKDAGLAGLVVLLLGILIFYLIKFFKWTAAKIRFHEGKRLNGIKIGSYDLFDTKRQVRAFLSLNTIFKWLLIVMLVYIAMPVLFGIFPWTRGFADTLFSYILDPAKKIALGLWHYLPNLFTIIVIVTFFRYVLKGIYFLKTEIETGRLLIAGFYTDWANPTYQIIKVVVYAFMAIVIFPYLPGSDSPVFQGVSVFLGVLFTFGSSGSLSNVVAGLVLTYMRLFKIGDRVKIGEVVGDVIEKSMLVTRIRTIKNEIISIPNSTVMSSHTINYSSDAAEKGLILYTTVTIGYDVPWATIHQALLNAADRTNMLLKEPKPFVLQTSLEDFYVSYQINAYTKEANKQANIYSQLHCNIQDCCNEMGIEILSPHYRAGRDGNMTTIPANYLAKDYQAPSFNVTIKKETE